MSQPFRSIHTGSWGSMLAGVCSCWDHVGSRLHQVGSKITQNRSMLAQTRLKLGSCWRPKPISRSQAVPGPSQAPPNLTKEATPHPPGLGSRIWSLRRLLLNLPNPPHGPQNTPTWLQKAPFQAQNPLPRPGGMGRSLFKYF